MFMSPTFHLLTESLKHETERYQFDILGLSEVRWTESGETEDKSIIF